MEMTKANIILRLEILERASKKLGVKIDLTDRKKEIYHLSDSFSDRVIYITERRRAKKAEGIIYAFENIRSEIRAQILIRRQRRNLPQI